MASTALNTFMRAILRSPLHGIVSKTILLISLKGRKSGKTYTVPVSYSIDGERVTIFTNADWVKNLEGGAPVTLRIQGKDYSGFATPNAHDLKAKSDGLMRHLSAVPGDARFYQVRMGKDGKPNRKQVEAAAAHLTMIRVKIKK